MTALSVLCNPPCSGVFITVVAGCRWTPLSPFPELLPLPAAKADQDSLVQVFWVMSWLTDVRPFTHLPLSLVGPVELVLDLVEAYHSLDSISQVYS